LPFIAQAMPDYIKVDRSTILQAVGSETFRRFLKDLVRALHNYATEGIVAEGIETDEEFEVSRTLGIDFAQGYRFGRPELLAALRRPA
jgi:EAL domain-containing protein (putative c-di-GMP-specific phosphodiesterase class I)